MFSTFSYPTQIPNVCANMKIENLSHSVALTSALHTSWNFFPSLFSHEMQSVSFHNSALNQCEIRSAKSEPRQQKQGLTQKKFCERKNNWMNRLLWCSVIESNLDNDGGQVRSARSANSKLLYDRCNLYQSL